MFTTAARTRLTASTTGVRRGFQSRDTRGGVLSLVPEWSAVWAARNGLYNPTAALSTAAASKVRSMRMTALDDPGVQARAVRRPATPIVNSTRDAGRLKRCSLASPASHDGWPGCSGRAHGDGGEHWQRGRDDAGYSDCSHTHALAPARDR